MPRKRKTLSGDAAQNIKSVPGRRYGENLNQQAMQRSMPAPQRQAPTPPRPVPLPEPTDQGGRPSPQPARVTRRSDVGGRPLSEPMPRITRGSDPIKRNTAQPIPSRLLVDRGTRDTSAMGSSMSLQDLLSNIPRNVLRQPGNPSNTLTNGISIGPGSGPNPASQTQAMSNYYRVLFNLAQRTNNPMIRSMLESL